MTLLSLFLKKQNNWGFPLKVKTVFPITTAQFPTPTERPNYSVLSKSKYIDTLGIYPPHWRDSLKKMLAELKSLN